VLYTGTLGWTVATAWTWEGKVIVEMKSVDRLLPVHKAQLLSYLRLARCKLGLLINFNVTRLTAGIVRVVNCFPESQRSQRSLR